MLIEFAMRPCVGWKYIENKRRPRRSLVCPRPISGFLCGTGFGTGFGKNRHLRAVQNVVLGLAGGQLGGTWRSSLAFPGIYAYTTTRIRG